MLELRFMTYVCEYGWMDGCMDGWMDLEGMYVRRYVSIRLRNCASVCVNTCKAVRIGFCSVMELGTRLLLTEFLGPCLETCRLRNNMVREELRSQTHEPGTLAGVVD